MSYAVTTDPYIGIGSGNLKRDGTYSIPVSNLQPSTTYTWTVELDDGKESVTKEFHFTTIKEEPFISNIQPADYSSVGTDLSELRFDLSDGQGDIMDYTVETSPDIGSDSGSDVGNDTVIIPIDWRHLSCP